MVIQQFNRLIKNKWVWGVFALTISALFLIPDEWVGRGRDEMGHDDAGKLGDRSVSMQEFQNVKRFHQINRELARRMNPGSAHLIPDVGNQDVWRDLGLSETARRTGLEATDEAVREWIRGNPQFSMGTEGFKKAAYENFLRAQNLSDAEYRSAVKTVLSAANLSRSLAQSSGWVSPVELSAQIDNLTDMFTVRVAMFTNENSTNTVDQAGIEAYYNAHTNIYMLPALKVVRYAVTTNTAERLAQFKDKVSDESVRSYYDNHMNEFKVSVPGTNGVMNTETKKFDDVKEQITRKLQVAASFKAYKDDFNQKRKLALLDEKGRPLEPTKVARDVLDKFVQAENLQVVTSKPFASAMSYNEKMLATDLLVDDSDVVPSCPEFVGVARGLKDDPYVCCGVAVGSETICFIECIKMMPARLPALDEVRKIVEPDALEEVQTAAFKKAVGQVRDEAKGRLAKGEAFAADMFGPTNSVSVFGPLTFSAMTAESALPRHLMQIVGSVMKLEEGNLSEFIQLRDMRFPYEYRMDPNRAVVVYVEKREPGKNASQRQMVGGQRSRVLEKGEQESFVSAWADWNLKNLGYTTSALTAVKSQKGSSDEANGQEN